MYCTVFKYIGTLLLFAFIMRVVFTFVMLISYQFFFPLALQPQFGPWPTSMKLPVSLRFARSNTFGRTPWAGYQLVANTEKRIHTNTKHSCP
jgi:hypothetical protein